jgi:hypothetical protein
MLGEQFARQPNALNLWRLLLASTVLVHHAANFTGADVPRPAYQLLSMVPVDAFFAASGFLICRSWHRRSHVGVFLSARARRLLPDSYSPSPPRVAALQRSSREIVEGCRPISRAISHTPWSRALSIATSFRSATERYRPEAW